MGIFGSSTSPEESLRAEEHEILSEIWEIINREEVDLEQIKQLDTGSSSLRKAERALKSLAVGVQQDLEKVEEEEEGLEVELRNSEVDRDVREALEHNLELLAAVAHHIEEIDGYLGESVEEISRETEESEKEDLLRVEQKAEENLEQIKREIETGGKEFNRGWIHLSEVE
ncbi:MAG: hypothetical protein ABEJ03_04365 [Candidatus Nanohaloarchaea archaeon]